MTQETKQAHTPGRIDIEISAEPERWENAAQVRAAIPSYGFKSPEDIAKFLCEAKANGVEPYQFNLTCWDYSELDEYGAPNIDWQTDGENWLCDNELNNPGMNARVAKATGQEAA